ncbi:MAG: ABC transporter permease [Microbacterium sp.]|uniref:ABC transporter permease n=1 Tax=Microbacterium sp. TaxID=51671 RepID=UPI001AD10CE9|nr:ABC transporter permease [Microbacterium sp.]MBN9154773.1 ABC transporter permease [Microbacterium sp.]
MSDLLSASVLTVFIASIIVQTMPLVIASVGETIGEQSGVLNLGIEGVMLIGALAGYATAIWTGSAWLGMLGGLLGGVAANLLMLVLNTWLGLNQIVVGLAVTLIGEGLTSVLYLQAFSKSPQSIPPDSWRIPGLSDIPVIGPALFRQSGIFWVCILLLVVVAFLLSRTNWGLATRSAGQKPSSLDAAGGSVMVTRSQAVLLNGAFVGLGGAYLSILTTGTFTPFMTNGLGFLAIVITMLSRGKVGWIVLTSLLYGIAVAIKNPLQLIGVSIPADVFQMLPFVVVMITLVLFARSSVVPPALGAPYTRGAR